MVNFTFSEPCIVIHIDTQSSINRFMSATRLLIKMHGKIPYAAYTDPLMMNNYLFKTCQG